VGSVFDLSNARVAKLLGAKVVIISQGGIGRPVDEVCLNQALFEKEGVEVIGVIVNKVLGTKRELVSEFVRRGLARKGLRLLGVLPHEPILSRPTLDLIVDELQAERLNRVEGLQNLVKHVIVGSMGVQRLERLLKPGGLLIVPGDREDLIVALSAATQSRPDTALAGMVLTDGLRPGREAMGLIERMAFPVCLVAGDSYSVAATVHDLTVKTRPKDQEKITLIRDLIARYVDVECILNSL
jgi:BioD-like phosphotransacetylase family protein